MELYDMYLLESVITYPPRESFSRKFSFLFISFFLNNFFNSVIHFHAGLEKLKMELVLNDLFLKNPDVLVIL
jgi:hypothetical protein